MIRVVFIAVSAPLAYGGKLYALLSIPFGKEREECAAFGWLRIKMTPYEVAILFSFVLFL